MEYASSSALTLGTNCSGNATVYYYSETQQAGYWHYVDGVPALLVD